MNSSPGVSDAGPKHSRRWLPLSIVVAVMAGVVVLLVSLPSLRRRPPAPMVRSQFPLPRGIQLAPGDSSLALSPDGQRLAFIGDGADGKRLIWTRAMSGGAVRALAGTDGASFPFWSADGKSIGFFAGHFLKKIDTTTGRIAAICAAEDGRGGSWNGQGTIVFAPKPEGGLYRVPASGGDPIPVAVPPNAATSDRLPQFLPDGRRVLFFSGTDAPGPGNGIYALELTTGKSRLVAREDSAGRYVAPGYLAFVRDGNLLVEPFDAKKLAPSGAPAVLVRNVAFDPREWTAEFSFSGNGSLVYEAATPFPKSRLTWMAADGGVERTIGAAQAFGAVTVSPDGKHAIAQIAGGSGGFLLWLYELQQGAGLRLTFPGSSYSGVLWSPNGKQIAYGDSSGNLYLQVSTGVKDPQKILSGAESVVPTGWSRDGRLLAYQVHGPQEWELWVLPLSGDRKPIAFLTARFNETSGTFSPDGHWFAYLADASGRNELYVVPYPAGGAAQKISVDGAIAGGWAPGLDEIAYVTPERKLVLVSAKTRDDKLELSRPETLLGGRALPPEFNISGAPGFFSEDGTRLLLPFPVQTGTAAMVSLVTHWPVAIEEK